MKKTSLLIAVASLSILSNVLYSPPAFSQNYSQVRGIWNAIDGILPRVLKQTPRNYQIVERTRTITGYVVTTVKTANSVYQIAIDCKQGLATNLEVLPSQQQVNLVRDICGHLPR